VDSIDRSPIGASDRWLIVGLVLIFAGVLGSLTALTRWKGEPGAVGVPPTRWPSSSTIARTPDEPTLLQFVTPACPCSRASLHELGELSSAYPHADTIIVVATDPELGARQHAAVLAAAREASRAPSELASAVMTLSAELQALAVSFEEAIAGQAEQQAPQPPQGQRPGGQPGGSGRGAFGQRPGNGQPAPMNRAERRAQQKRR